MIGFIKNLINGIVSFFTGLFSKKKDGYYIQLDEAAEATKQAAKQATSKAKEVADSVASKAQEVVEPAVSKAQEVVEPAVSKAQKAVEPVTAKAATKNGTKDAAAAVKPKAAKVELVQTANGVKPEPAQPEKAKAVIQKQPAETTFAPKYLAVPDTSNGRRRPGANMSSFLDMARQVKTTK
ncbi:MAG: hypothetical protein HC862_27305 [Scytonema sp. RU_4_4]|nr:hypothetical protein [Scytonema sp. RU_4_4]NJR75650.1 hypothetical protein [Scytonema sp. CRU_2_7]